MKPTAAPTSASLSSVEMLYARPVAADAPARALPRLELVQAVAVAGDHARTFDLDHLAERDLPHLLDVHRAVEPGRERRQQRPPAARMLAAAERDAEVVARATGKRQPAERRINPRRR